jgi:glycosyltransferase involved in cell wall biosynthesis
MEPFNLLQRALVTPIPGLPGRGYSDLRWFITQSLTARRIIREEIRSWDPTVVHVTVNGAALLLPPLQTELPCVPAFDTTMSEWMRMLHQLPQQETDLAHPWRVLQELERNSLRAAPLVISWSRHVSDQLHALAPQSRIATLHPGLDLHAFTPSFGPRRPGAPRILFVGGRFEAKGGPALLLAAESLAVPVEVHVVTTERVQPHPLMTLHRVEPGTQDLADLFRDADLFCLPTTADAVPWAILEAQASGLPVISTRVGSIPDMLPEECGRVVEPGDPVALREALDEVLGDEGLLHAMGQAGRARVEAQYDAKTNTARLVELLDRVGEHGGRHTAADDD